MCGSGKAVTYMLRKEMPADFNAILKKIGVCVYVLFSYKRFLIIILLAGVAGTEIEQHELL